MSKQKQFFAIYRDNSKQFLHSIESGTSKKLVKSQLRDDGYTVKGVFSQKDINNILNFEFTDVNVSNQTIDYLKENLDFWNDRVSQN